MNLHTINDNRGNPQQSERRMQPRQQHNQQPQPDDMDLGPILTAQQYEITEKNKVLHISGRQVLKDPLQQHYGDMLVDFFCPSFFCISITTFLVLAITAVFVAEVIQGLEREKDFLEVSFDTVVRYGGVFASGLRDGEVWRFVTAIFIHLTFVHYIFNILFLFFLVSRVQHTYGSWKTLIFFLVTGIAGNIFSVAINDDQENRVAAGASTALYGMLGIFFGYGIINWEGLKLIGDYLRYQYFCFLILLLIIIIPFTPNSRSQDIDYFGHLGGFLAGIWIAFAHETIIDTGRQKYIRIAFAILLTIQIVVPLLTFYLG